MEYLLIVWPDVQELMDYPFFRKECYLLQAFDDQHDYGGAYFVPKARLEEIGRDNTSDAEQE